ncbi:MAG: stage III sporulation protein AF [Clostridiaceae bacterium]|nr:stage III sporulation protein AF [Clostridiaceae bacterium]
MKELIQNILIYLILVSLLRGLITNPKYQQYFQFFSGLILMLLLLSPVISLMEGEEGWFALLQENVLQMDLDEVKGEMAVAEGKFTDVLEKEYQEVVEEQVEALAREQGMVLEDTVVELEKEEEEYRIASISGRVSEAETDLSDRAVETIQIGEDQKLSEEDDSKKAKKLQKKLCSQFLVGEEQVHLWK